MASDEGGAMTSEAMAYRVSSSVDGIISLEPDVIQEDYGITPLHSAAAQGNTDLVRNLVTAHKLDINVRDDEGNFKRFLECCLCCAFQVCYHVLYLGLDFKSL